ncbi:unnamed protein product [Bursaphelenchus xylophilus]|uniref:(pine wood nematode) hypothetical protein n=1 Tax=Bursaphelenchus xylophilus TaxID=6326 RepID=A0A1I7SQH2_BURXY|nr:unnamed protein product [Bursaphelenchus xylophilus]CAG9109896.1 unnamed protein product [Bursaphelenchus xylophilus]
MRVLATIAIATLAASVSAYCPEFLYNQTVCSCSEYIDGAIIRCNGPESPHMVEKLKKYHPEIRELALENANILEIGARAFGSLKIKKLVLDNNRIKAINANAFKGLEKVLQELHINNNKLPDIPTDAIEDLTALNILSLKCNEIGNLSANALVGLPTLIEINLGCNKIANIAADAFDQVRGTLQNINLDNNQLKRIPSKAIENMTSLIGLHMKYNKIEKLEKHQLQRLPNLAMLSLTGNKISSIDKQFVNNVTTLKYVYLADNKVKDVSAEILRQFASVEILDLSYNNIGDLVDSQFSVLENIQHLNLEGNHIKTIQKGAFNGTPLLLLWLPYNCLSNVSADTFKGIPFVKHISLAYNNLKDVEAFTFGHLANLHTLDLSYNLLDSIQTSSIMGPDFLTTRIQENPLVCKQDGFHVMNGRDALNLTNEPNLICKTPTKEQCPQKGNRPAPQVCNCKKATKKLATAAPTTLPTTTTAVPETSVPTSAAPVKPSAEERNLVAAIAAAAQRHQQNQMLSQHDLDKAAEAARRLNMERFMRLSKTPAEGIIHQAHHDGIIRQPTFLERQKGLLARSEQLQQQNAEILAKSKSSVVAPVEFSHDEQVETVSRDETVPVAHVPNKS